MSSDFAKQPDADKREIARLSARVAELKSTWSYRLSAPIRFVERAINSHRKRPLAENLARAYSDVRKFIILRDRAAMTYQEWIDKFDRLTAQDVALIAADIRRLKTKPRIAVVILPGRGELAATLTSLANQFYRRFEILAAAAVVDRTGLSDVRTRIIRRESITSEAQFFNAAVAAAASDFCIALNEGDVLAPHALYMYARAANDHPDAHLIYADEDDLTPGGCRSRPFFKPGWNPQLALAFDYVGRTALYRVARLRSASGASLPAGCAWRWALLLHLTETKGDAEPVRLPFVLLHRDAHSAGKTPAELEEGRRVVGQALARRQSAAAITIDRRGWLSLAPTLPARAPHVSIIIPTRDRCGLLKKCVESILKRTTYQQFDIVIVDNLSQQADTFAYFKSLEGNPRISIIKYAQPFNYAALHNAVVPNTRGELLTFLNNDVEVISGNWLERMVAMAVNPDVGVVGANLYYPDDTLQHAGVTVDAVHTAAHVFIRLPRAEPGPRGLLKVPRDAMAVTGACMLLRRSVFVECDGFDERLAVDFNDIDLCMRIRERGYRAVLAADAELYHHESATRGALTAADTRRRYEKEAAIFRERWITDAMEDRFFNPNLARDAANNGLAFPPRTKKPWHFDDARTASGSAARTNCLSPQLELGVALYGLFHSEIGVGQAARGIAEAFRTTTFPLSCHVPPIGAHLTNSIHFPCSSGLDSPYDHAVIMLNAIELVALRANEALPLRGKHRIGFWHWELPVFPAIWAPAFDMIDEIWVPSAFAANALASATTKPINVVPHVVRAAAVEKKRARRLIGIPQEAFVFLTTFDIDSYPARKNPEAAVRAFLDAFPKASAGGPLLVIKCRGRANDASKTLRRLVGGDERVMLFDRVFSPAEMAALTCAADAFVSLHRSEGFGLNIAEAMAAGNLAIATDFSGNTDFMTADNSILIPYCMRAIEAGEYIQGSGQWWAEPDHNAAVEALRLAARDQVTTRRLGARARRDLAMRNSPEAIGRILQAAITHGAAGERLPLDDAREKHTGNVSGPARPRPEDPLPREHDEHRPVSAA